LKKRYGQHFISDRNILQRIAGLAGIQSEDTVIEIGPGAGSLTRVLAGLARRVIAIEIDAGLIPQLRASLPANVEVLHADALELDFAKLASGPTHIVGNLPYNVATPLIRRFIAARSLLAGVTAMLQKEVAERICAPAGTKAYGPLTVLVQYYAIPVWGFTVPPGAFTPRPKVDSAVLRLDWKRDVADAPDFTDFVHRVFNARRKKLLNNLVTMYPAHSRDSLLEILASADIDASARAETLSIEQFHRVYNSIG
jgi:16S rRNA (adenine1518-N6/adenine1519-N6)-dimethyltransferase